MRTHLTLLSVLAIGCAPSGSNVYASGQSSAPARAITPVTSPTRHAEPLTLERSPAPTGPGLPAIEPEVGVMVMAHGGDEAWNESVAAAVAPLGDHVATSVAYGMANPMTLRASLEELAARGVQNVAVVRLFISGDSFRDQTEYFLGIREDRPENIFLMGRDPSGVGPIEHDLTVVTHPDGLMISQQARDIAIDRARTASASRADESVLLIAHGMGDPVENDRVLASMAPIVAQLETDRFARVHAATLREDWADAREVAEKEIRAFVQEESERGRQVIVVPMRLSGFGPYAGVLEGLEYVPTEGLLPHDEIGSWIEMKARSLVCGEGWAKDCSTDEAR